MKRIVRVRTTVWVALLVGGLSLSLTAAWQSGNWIGLARTVGAEMVGAGLIYLLLERVAGRIERHEVEKALLTDQLGSRVREVAVGAAEKLRWHSWLHDGSLRGARLEKANLQRAYLWQSDLGEANLGGANLQGADLGASVLKGANLGHADLREADLWQADLRGADLWLADLQSANLDAANLQCAYLRYANLREARLGQANLQGATLPDGRRWRPGVDMDRYTDPMHPDFWPSEPQPGHVKGSRDRRTSRHRTRAG
jgi:hypothetical protein